MSELVSDPEGYFGELVPARDELLLALEKEALVEGVPIVGPVVGELLYLLARSTRAKRILELGTATGYSGIYLARALSDGEGKLVTLERDPKMAARAKANFQKAHLHHCVEIKEGDALKAAAALQEAFDFIFLDIEKKDYARVLPDCERLLSPGGVLVADNVAFQAADDFNRAVARSPAWRPVHLYSLLPLHSPEKDGLCLALRV